MNNQEILRYARNIKLENFGAEGQRSLLESKVLIIGVGGLGLICAGNLAANGVGKLGLIDYDIVDISNLHRQILYDTSQIGQGKSRAAREKLLKINPRIDIQAFNTKATPENIIDLIEDYDIVVDGTDNISTHYLINDACYLNNKRLVQAGVVGYEGFVTSIIPKHSHCYRCIYPSDSGDNAPYCSNTGVYGISVNLVGTLQANEVIKLLLSHNNVLVNKILTIDLFSNTFKTVDISKNFNCPLCGQSPSIHSI